MLVNAKPGMRTIIPAPLCFSSDAGTNLAVIAPDVDLTKRN